MTQNTLKTTNSILNSEDEKMDIELLEELNEHLVRIENIPQEIIDSIMHEEEVSEDDLYSLAEALSNVDLSLEEYYDLVMTSILSAEAIE